MTTIKQRRWLSRDLLERNSDLVQIDRFSIWIRPINHCIAGIWIKSCRDPNLFYPKFNITPLYWVGASTEKQVCCYTEDFPREPRPAPFTREYLLEHRYDPLPPSAAHDAWRASVGLWEWTVPGIDRIFTRAVEEQVLPLLRPMAADHRAYLDFYRRIIIPDGRLHDEQRMAIAIAEGCLDEARTFLAQVWKWYETDSYGDYEPPDQIDYPKPGQRSRAAIQAWEKAYLCTGYRKKRRRILEVVEPLRTGDRSALAAILHRWEAEAARFHGVERWWEPTPFPIEEGLG